MEKKTEKIHIRSNGRISISRKVDRAVRYQVARFCQWEDETPYEYRYSLSPASLRRANNNGLEIHHLITLLRKHAKKIPPNILNALHRWDENGSEVRIQKVSILQVGSPQILKSLKRTKAARFLGDILSATVVTVKPGSEEKVLAALSEMGYFGEFLQDQ
jgi:hypothetical protein